MLLPSRALENAELFSPVWPADELRNADMLEVRAAECEPASMLPLNRELCMFETARLGEIAELRPPLESEDEDTLPEVPADPPPVRVPFAMPAWAQAKFEFPAVRPALVAPAPPNECH